MGQPIDYAIRRVVTYPPPAVAGEVSVVATRGRIWRILSLTFDLTTDANVANRAVALAANDGSSVFWRVGPAALQAAGQTNQYSAYAGAGSSQTTGGVGAVPLPQDGLWLESGWALVTVTDLIQAGDQYANVVALVEEYPLSTRGVWEPRIITP